MSKNVVRVVAIVLPLALLWLARRLGRGQPARYGAVDEGLRGPGHPRPIRQAGVVAVGPAKAKNVLVVTATDVPADAGPARAARRTLGSLILWLPPVAARVQRYTPVWPSEYRPGWGKTHTPWGPKPTGTRRINLPVRVESA